MTEIEMIQAIDGLAEKLQTTLDLFHELAAVVRTVNANVRFLADAVGVELPTP